MLDDKDIRIDTFTPGVWVRVVHMPTGVMADASHYPTQNMNKYFALGVLTERLEQSNKHTAYPPEFPAMFTATVADNFDKEGYEKTLEALGLRTQNTGKTLHEIRQEPQVLTMDDIEGFNPDCPTKT